MPPRDARHLIAGLIFIWLPEKDIPGDAETDEARKGNSKKDIVKNFKELHVESQLKLCS